MRYMMLLKANSETEAGVLPTADVLIAMGNFNQQMINAGVLLGGDGLQASSRGARVHFSGDKRTVVDGPFAETKELLAGYWMIDVKSREEAIEWAKRCPNGAAEMTIEVRKVFEASDFPAELFASPEGEAVRKTEADFRARTNT